MPLTTSHPQRVALHNEIHARPPEAMVAPLAISHLVMLGDAAEREASRAHLAALLRDHHLPLPDAQSTHLRMDLGPFRLRWELHTEFVTWSFSRAIDAAVSAIASPPPPSNRCRSNGWRRCRASCWPACTCGWCRRAARAAISCSGMCCTRTA